MTAHTFSLRGFNLPAREDYETMAIVGLKSSVPLIWGADNLETFFIEGACRRGLISTGIPALNSNVK